MKHIKVFFKKCFIDWFDDIIWVLFWVTFIFVIATSVGCYSTHRMYRKCRVIDTNHYMVRQYDKKTLILKGICLDHRFQ